jgi:ADP-heptose:LPS heptosyltransferase
LPRIVLSRALSYQHASIDRPGTVIAFRRGEPREVGDADYDFLLSRGTFTDPEFELNVVHPRQLRMAGPGTEIPILRTGGMGDVLMASIAVREFALARPDLRPIYATSEHYLPLVRDLPMWGVRTVKLSGLRGRHQFAIDLRGYAERDRREEEFRVDVFSSYLVGRPPRDYGFPFVPTAADRAAGLSILGDPASSRPWLGIVVAASMGSRSWPADYSERLGRLALDAGWGVAILHHAPVPFVALEERGAVNLTGRTSIADLVRVVQALRVLVAPDTGTMHLGEAVRVRTVALMTTVEPDARLRRYRWTRALWAGLPCSPCYHNCCEWPDPKPCALAISPETAWAEALRMDAAEPPWPVEASFEPGVVHWPGRPPVKPRAKVARLLGAGAA